jgi:hypothetical protein
MTANSVTAKNEEIYFFEFDETYDFNTDQEFI